VVHVQKGKRPPTDYHAPPVGRYLGELIRKDGTRYSRIERRAYYADAEVKHIAKTPLHIARWAVQQFTKPGDWVFDPTMGAGTTAVEALRAARNAAGVEIQYVDVVQANIEANNCFDKKYSILHGDARNMGDFLKGLKKKFALTVNNPPYSGDARQKGFWKDTQDKFQYDDQYPNLAFMGENDEYFEAMSRIYATCLKYTKPKGHLVIGVKDMMRNKQPFMLHQMLADAVMRTGLAKAVGTAVLKHHPGTLHLNTYEKRFGVRPPLYQTIMVFQRKEAK